MFDMHLPPINTKVVVQFSWCFIQECLPASVPKGSTSYTVVSADEAPKCFNTWLHAYTCVRRCKYVYTYTCACEYNAVFSVCVYVHKSLWMLYSNITMDVYGCVDAYVCVSLLCVFSCIYEYTHLHVLYNECVYSLLTPAAPHSSARLLASTSASTWGVFT